MNRLIGWTLFAVLTPVMLVGGLSYLVWSALVFGWGWARSWLEELG